MLYPLNPAQKFDRRSLRRGKKAYSGGDGEHLFGSMDGEMR
jgi:hypothetical protein